MSHVSDFDRRPAAAPAFGWARALHAATMFGFFAYVFIGTQPLSDPSVTQRVDGSPLDRIAVLGLFALALASLAANWRATLSLAARNLGLGLVVLVCLASVYWSGHPDLTLRRAILLFMLSVAAAGVAAGVKDFRAFHTSLFVTLVAIVGLNILATAALPGVAITDIGVRGIYSQKNVAGVVAMVAVVVAATWTLGATTRRSVLAGLAGCGLSGVFLLATLSKTSVALTALALMIAAAIWIAERLGPRAVALGLAAAAIALAGLFVALAATGFDLNRFASLFTSDTSFTGRDELWAFALDRAQERFWLGHGYGAFWDVGPGADPLLRVDPGSWLGDVEIGAINQAHNGYLELWLQVGLPVTILATLVVLLRAGTGARGFFSERTGRSERWAFGMLSLILLLYLLHNLTEASLFMRGLPFCNVALLAMFSVSRRRKGPWIARHGRTV